MSLRIRLALALVTAVIACDPYSVSTLTQTAFEAQCHVIFACCSPEERLSQVGGFVQLGVFDEATCKEKFGAFGKITDQANDQAVANGRAKYDEDLARKCSQPLIDAANSCDSQKFFAPDPPPDACLNDDGTTKSPITGLVKDGDLCFQDFECAEEGSHCERNTSDDDKEVLITTKGKCVGLPGIGDSCADTFTCKAGAFCDFNDETCKAVGGNGDPCDESDQCGTGLRCDFNNNTCAAAGDDGDTCFSGDDCKHRCDDNTGLCAAPGPDGTFCTADHECAAGVCDQDFEQCGNGGGGAVDEIKRVVDQCNGKVE